MSERNSSLVLRLTLALLSCLHSGQSTPFRSDAGLAVHSVPHVLHRTLIGTHEPLYSSRGSALGFANESSSTNAWFDLRLAAPLRLLAHAGHPLPRSKSFGVADQRWPHSRHSTRMGDLLCTYVPTGKTEGFAKPRSSANCSWVLSAMPVTF